MALRNRIAELRAVMRKEIRQTFRDKRMLAMMIVAPTMQLILLGFAVNLDVDHIRTAVTDRDNSAESRALAQQLLASKTLRGVGHVVDPAAAMRAGRATVVVVLPRGLHRSLRRVGRGRAPKIQVLVDGSDPLQGQAALDAIAGALRANLGGVIARRRELMLGRALLARAPPAVLPAPPIHIQPRILYNPRLRSPIYMVPGVAAMVLLIVTTMITAMGIARERELGTIEQLMVTPMRPISLLLGKILPFGGVGIVVAGLVISVGTNLFDVPIRGSLAVVFVGTVLYLLSTLGTGILISTVASTQQQAVLGSFFFLLPAILLSGFMSPVENMPSWIQPLTLANPVRYYVEILRNCLIKGATFADLSRQLLTLGGFGVAILTIAAVRFKKRL